MARVRIAAKPFEAPVASRLRAALANAHARDPFRPREVRRAVSRVVDIARGLEMTTTTYRGGLDVGGAELDHVWAVIEDRVVDVVLPLRSDTFLDHLRRYVAGEIEDDDLDHHVHAYDLGWRVLGEFPTSVRYIGAPVWSHRVA